MYIKIDDDTVVTLSGDEYRRAPTEQWASYEAWCAEGNEAAVKFTPEQWDALHANSRMPLSDLKPE